MTAKELLDWLTLWHVPTVGPRRFLTLLHAFDNDPGNALNASTEALIKTGLPSRTAHLIRNQDSTKAQADIAWQQSRDEHQILTFFDPSYPAILREISDPPPLLYITGQTEALTDSPCLAVVGSRKATALGRLASFELSRELSFKGITVVSGLAVGIDGQAHRGALASGNGKTIAVLANGLTRIYPPQHRNLAQEIRDSGVLVSEFSPWVNPLPQHFPRRNRIISGLSLGTIIIEAAAKSGSLVTARFALEQNREVFATPGPIFSAQSMGCHSLIQQGAKLVTKVEDILVEFPTIEHGTYSDQCVSGSAPGPEAEKLLDFLEHTPISVDLLIEKSGLTPDQVSSMLIELEVSGHVICDAYSLYTRSAMD